MAEGQDKKDPTAFAIMAVVAFFAFAMLFQKPLAYIIILTSIPLLSFFGSVFNDEMAIKTVEYLTLNIKEYSDLEGIGYTDMYALLDMTGLYFRWIFILPLVFLGIHLIVSDEISNLNRFLGFQDLLKEKSVMFPAIRPIVGLDLLSNKHLSSGWRYAENPIDYSLRFNLISIDGKPLTLEDIYLRQEIESSYDKSRSVLDKKKLEEKLKNQVGRCLYKNNEDAMLIRQASRERVVELFMTFAPHQRGLLLVMLMRSLGRAKWQKSSYDLLEQMSNSFWIDKHANKEVNTSWGRLLSKFKLIRRRSKNESIWTMDSVDVSGVDFNIKKLVNELDDVKFEMLRITLSKHAWSSTLFIRLMEMAREYGGVLITADFIWLKPVERTLFYVLNSAGRKTPLTEASGAFSHYYIEDFMKKGNIELDVETAITAFEQDIRKEGWIS